MNGRLSLYRREACRKHNYCSGDRRLGVQKNFEMGKGKDHRQRLSTVQKRLYGSSMSGDCR